MKKRSELDYIFAVGRIRAMERFLIPSSVFEEAIESGLSDALKLFAETDLYTDKILHIKDSQELEEIFNNELAKLKKLIAGLLLDKQLLGFLELDSLKCAEAIMKDYSSSFLHSYLMHLIDMHNIKTFLRLYILKEPQELLKNSLACEGFIKKDVFLGLYTKDPAAFMNRLEYVYTPGRVIDYAYFLREAIERLEKEGSFILLEKSVNDFLVEALKPAKYLAFGPEPVIAYYLAKANEINLIRMVILAKLNEMPQQQLKERLNAAYA